MIKPAATTGASGVASATSCPGHVTAADMAGLSSAPIVQGSELPISADLGVHVGDASVVSADTEVSNGLINTIDRVLLQAAA